MREAKSGARRSAQSLSSGIKRKIFRASEITEYMLDDIEAYRDVYESAADMNLVMCETNADVIELDYAPLELKDCDDACVYWGSIGFKPNRTSSDHLPRE